MSYTARLREAQAKGARIVCADPPYDGWTMFYCPRHKTDNQPWRLAGDSATNGYRYSGGELRAEFGPRTK